MHYRTILLTSLLATSTLLNAAVLIDFNEATDLNDFTSENSPFIAAGGIGGSNALTDSAGMSAGFATLYNPVTFDASATGFSQDLSVFFKYDLQAQVSTSTAFDRILGLGLTENTTPNDYQNSSNSVAVMVGSPSSGNIQVTFFHEVLNSRTTSNPSGNSFAATDDHWYFLDVSFTNTSATQWNITAQITDYGTAGASAIGGPLVNLNNTLTVSNALFDDALRVQLQRSENDRTGIVAYDNLTVPEPGTYALMVGFLALGFVCIRRRMRR